MFAALLGVRVWTGEGTMCEAEEKAWKDGPVQQPSRVKPVKPSLPHLGLESLKHVPCFKFVRAVAELVCK